MPKESGNTVSVDGGFFADVVRSHYQPAEALIRVDSLQPYRVTAKLLEPGWIETSRVWLPGYQAVLDGKPIEHKTSHRGLTMVSAQPGKHQLELRYVGTTKLWIAFCVTVLTALIWILWYALSRRARIHPVGW